ncbi:YWFCY domain-containing protein, partial [uncultured Duncaniella sp.]|uniref:YWFCY domain-containing protein n=1 Tax=uncultured Duncaniella sp. TaxID=2768039 RepID=UPI0025B689B2
MSQQEDDLRSLAKIMDMLRGVAMILVVANIYWFCQSLIGGWRFHAETMKVLGNLNEAGGLFNNPWNAKWWTLLLLALSCFGTKGVKDEAITWRHIIIVGAVGVVVFLFNSWLLPIGYRYIYIITTILGYIGMLMSGIWISRMLKNNMMDDRFND